MNLTDCARLFTIRHSKMILLPTIQFTNAVQIESRLRCQKTSKWATWRCASREYRKAIELASLKVQLFSPIFSPKVYGDFFAPTSEKFPWNVATGAIKNKVYDAENLINAETWRFSNDLNALVR